jgi:D-amino-acid dehydrogenase
MKAVIIGGGIIGLSSAYYLLREGFEVTVVDQTDLSDNCSLGNLGMIVPSHFVPLAAPGIVSQGIRWMFDAKSPFYVKPSLNPSLIKWGLKFIRSANEKNVNNAAPYLRDLNLFSKKLYEELAVQPGFDFSFEKKGIIMYFKTQQVADEEIHLAETARSMGLDVVVRTKEELQMIEPGASVNAIGGVHYQCDAHLSPDKLNAQLIGYLKKEGVVFHTGKKINKVVVESKQIKKVVADDLEIEGDVFVMAAGSWMPELMKMIGLNLSLVPGKGYSFTIDHPVQKLNVPAILCEARVAITPMNGRMRYGGTMEINAINKKVNMKRVQGIVESVADYLPGLALDMPAKEDVWYGFRPCSPDGLPYIGYGNVIKNMLYAGGHAMMGLSLGPATGKLIAELATHQKTSVGMDAFYPERFM